MAGTQAPKGFGLVFALVGVPLILWSAWGTKDELAALDSTEARQAQCIEKTSHLASLRNNAEDMCHCVVLEAEKRGITQRYGAYDEDALMPVVEMCYQAHVVQ
jgi:hypothetical protein